LSSRKPGFDPRSVHVRFVLDKVDLGQDSLPVPVSPVSTIPPLLSTHISLSQYLFPLSVPFHHRSVPTFHSSSTCFPCQYHSTIAQYPHFPLPLPVSPLSTIPPSLRTHISLSQYLFPLSVPFHHRFVPTFPSPITYFPCQYHSTVAQYPHFPLPLPLSLVSTIPPLLRTHISLSHYLFPLSVPLHHCSVPTFPSPITYFPCQYHSTIAPYPHFPLPLPISPVSTIPPLLRTHISLSHYLFPLSVPFHHRSVPTSPSPSTCFPCQYHSTIAQYPHFLHISQTTYGPDAGGVAERTKREMRRSWQSMKLFRHSSPVNEDQVWPPARRV